MVYGVRLDPIINPIINPIAKKQIIITTALYTEQGLGANLAIVSAKSIALSTILGTFVDINNYLVLEYLNL